MVLLLVLLTIAVVIAVEALLSPRWGSRRERVRPEVPAPRPLPETHPVLSPVRGVHAGHTWAQVGVDDSALIGVTDLGPAMLGHVQRVELPAVGATVRQGETFVVLHRGRRQLPQPAPLSGVVVEVNPALSRHPRLVNESPFERGWIARLDVADPWNEMDNLLRGAPAERWLDAMRMELARWFAPHVGPAMADGGVPAADPSDRLPDDAWCRLRESFFPRSVPRAEVDTETSPR
jgi:glycine cleavage system H protein